MVRTVDHYGKDVMSNLPITTPNDESELRFRAAYERVGDEGIERLVAAFYRRVPQDDILGPMYPKQDFAGAEKRLRDFLRFRWGGRMDYIEERGHPRLRMRHVPFVIDQAARDRWMKLMSEAFIEAEFPEEVIALFQPFLDNVATFLINSPSAPTGRP